MVEERTRRQSPEYQAEQAEESRKAKAEKDARLDELRAGAEPTVDEMFFLWDTERQMERRSEEWYRAVAEDAAREQAEALGGPESIDVDVARDEMVQVLREREIDRLEDVAAAQELARELEEEDAARRATVLTPQDVNRYNWRVAA